jgi:hypothetical protein
MRAVNYAGWAERPRREEVRASFLFFFFEISNVFSILISLWFSNQTQTKFQIQTNSNMCIKQKNNLGSA